MKHRALKTEELSNLKNNNEREFSLSCGSFAPPPPEERGALTEQDLSPRCVRHPVTSSDLNLASCVSIQQQNVFFRFAKSTLSPALASAGMTYRLFLHSLVCLFILLTGCEKLNSTQGLFANNVYVFPGAATLDDQGDGTFKLSWESVPVENITYKIFSRTSGDYNFQKSDAEVTTTTWVTPVTDLSKKTCFVVRYFKVGVEDDKNINEQCTKNDALVFGIKGIEPNDDGSWTLSWDPAPFKNVTYSVFSRLKTADYNFNAPIAQPITASYRTADMTFSADTCYVIRYTVNGVSFDTNMKELCLGRAAYSFKGLSGLSVNSDGSYLLSWTAIPGAVQTNYNIFTTATSGQYDFSKPIGTVTANSYKSPLYPIDVNRCFVVRASLSNQTDLNIAEMCSQQGVLTDFSGVANVTSPDTGIAEITWVKSTNAAVAGYRVYQGSNFSIKVAEVGANAALARVSGLATDSTQTFGVRAYDQYGREDSNTRTMSVTIVNLTSPTFAGLQSVTGSGATGAILSWVQAGGSPAAYRVYHGAVDLNETQPSTTAEIQAVIDWGTPFATVTGSTSTAHSASGLGDDQKHYFAVRAATSSGIEDTNVIIKSLTVNNNGAAVFAGITNLSNSAGKGAVTWAAPLGQVSQFLISWTTGGVTDSATIPAKTNGVIITSFTTPSRLNDNSTYTFSVRSIDRFNNQDTNTATRNLTLADTTPPAQLTNIVATALDENRIQFTFNKSTEGDFSNYVVRVCTGTTGSCTSDGSYTLATASFSTVSNTVTATITGLIAKTTYTFRLISKDSSGNESDPAVSQIATLDQTAPLFTGVLSSDINQNDGALLRISWPTSASSDVQKYYVFVGTNVDLSAASLNTGGALANGITRYVVTANPNWSSPLLAPVVSGSALAMASSVFTLDLPNLTSAMGNTYYVRVWVGDDASPANVNQSTVQVSKAIPIISPPTAPTYAGSWSAPDGGVKLTWNNITDAQQYTVYRAVVGQAFSADTSPTAVVSAGTLVYIDTMAPGTNDGSSFKYRVKAKNGTLYSTNSDDSGSISIPDRVAPTFAGVTGASYNGTSGFITLMFGTATDTVSGFKRFQVYAKGQAGVSTITAGNTYSLGTKNSGTTVTIGTTGSGADLIPTWSLEVGQKYNFRVEAEDNSGNISSTSWSSDIVFGVDATPATLNVNAIPGNTVLATGQAFSLTWSVNKAGTFYLKCNSTAMKNQAVTQSDVNGGTYPTVQITYADLGTACNGTGLKSIQYSFIDIGGLSNGNSVTDGSIAMSVPPASSVTNLKLYKVGEGSTGEMRLSWINPSFLSGDTLKILRKTGASAPSTATDGTVVATGVSQSTTSYFDSTVGTLGNQSYAVFVCNVYGACSTDTTSNGAVWSVNITALQNTSVGGNAAFSWTTAGTTPYIRLAVSTSRKALAIWDGVSTNAAISVVTTTGAETGYSSGSDASPFQNVSPWEQRYFRLSVSTAASGTNTFALSEVRTWARVPEGMVYVAKEDWPKSEYGQIREKAHDFAIDRYESYETTTTANPGGNAGTAAYPNTYNKVLKSAASQAPKASMDWFRFKQGCYNRTLEPELTNYIIGTATTLHPRRQVHLATDMEWFIAAAGTPDVAGATNCNTDSRGTPFNTGTSNTQNCVSKFGAYDMIGNVWEWTDGYFSNITGAGAAQTRTTYYGTSYALNETTMTIPTGSQYVTSFDWNTALPNATSGSANSSFSSDYFWLATGNIAALRGGNWAEGSQSGRFAMSVIFGPTTVYTFVGGRCALSAPAPRITAFQNDSIGGLARFYWNVTNQENEGSVNVTLAFGSSKEEIDGWNGESASLTNGGVITFTTSGGTQTYSSSTMVGLTGCASYTPTATGVSGSCSLDLSAAPFNLSPWQKRYFKLYASNTTVASGGPGPGAVSKTAVVGYVPPGMVLVAKEDWPVENVGDKLGWDYKTGSAANTTYDGQVGPFDYAIDKYEAYETTTVGINPGGTAGSAAYPNTYNSVLKSASGQAPKASMDWFRFKQGCENRTSETDFAAFVGNTTLAKTATTADPRRRVHLATDPEWFMAAAGTNDVAGATNCNTDSRATPYNTGTANTANCISRYGALDMIGNVWEWTDSYWASIASNAGIRSTFYGTGASYAINDSSFTLPAASNYISSFDFTKLLPITAAASGTSFFFSDYFWLSSGNIAALRGGSWYETSQTGRFATNLFYGPTPVGTFIGGRCALSAP